MSKKISLEVSFLVQGLFPVKNYEIDNFKLQTNTIDQDLLEPIFKEKLIYVPIHLINSSYQVKGKKDSTFLTLTNKNYIFETEENQIDLNEREVIKLAQDNLNLLDIKDNLEKELKLITNINIVLPMGIVKYSSSDEDVGNISFGMITKNSSNQNIFDYTDELKELLSHRLSRGISIKSLYDLGENNSRFKRALTFYYDSFVPNDRNVRFILLFSSLEALFNLDRKEVTEKIASSTSKILFITEEEEEKEIYKKIKEYYNKRSFYIHGNNPKEITSEDEFYLRECVRKVILIYWQISLNENIRDPKKIISFVQKNNKPDLNVHLRLFIKYLEDKDYVKLHKEILSIVLQ